MTRAFLLLLATIGMAAPAFATRGPVSAHPDASVVMILAKARTDKEASAENRPALCRPIIKPAPDGRVVRPTVCVKPRPILM